MATAVQHAILRNITSTILNRTQAGTLRGATGYISEFARLVNTKAGSKKDIRQANERLVKAGQAASLKRYDQRRAASDTPGQYRMSAGRISGGRLRRAIASKGFISFDANSIGIGNVAKLNKEAAHWARINWSAGPQQGNSPQIRLRFDDRIVATIAADRRPAPLWNIPQGAYFNSVGEMHINTRGAGMSAGPIKAAHNPYHFIEAGFQEIAVRFGPEYETMMFGWLQKSGQEAKNFAKGVRLKNVTLR